MTAPQMPIQRVQSSNLASRAAYAYAARRRFLNRDCGVVAGVNVNDTYSGWSPVHHGPAGQRVYTYATHNSAGVDHQ